MFRLFHIKVLPNLWGYVNIKAWIIPVSLPFGPPLCGHKKMHACRNTQTKTNCGKICFLFLLFNLFPPSSLALCALPFSLYPDLIRLQGMQAEWKHRDKYTAEIWVSASKLRLAHWHRGREMGEGEAWKDGGKRKTAGSGVYDVKSQCLVSNDALKYATCGFIMLTDEKKTSIFSSGGHFYGFHFNQVYQVADHQYP